MSGINKKLRVRIASAKISHVAVGLAAITFTGCAGGRSEMSSSAQAHVSQKTLNEAAQVAAKIDYLPTTYVQDGCYARATYISMELAAVGIPSSAQFVSTCHNNRNATDLLELPDGTQWNWHVAPLLLVEHKPFIIDLSFSTEPMPRQKWVEKFKGNSSDDRKRYFEASQASENSSGWGKENNCGEDLGLETVVSNIKEMKPFQERNLLNTCQLMASHVREEKNLSNEQKNEKIERLVARTVFLHGALKKQGLLEPSSAEPRNTSGSSEMFMYKNEEDFHRFSQECRKGQAAK